MAILLRQSKLHKPASSERQFAHVHMQKHEHIGRQTDRQYESAGRTEEDKSHSSPFGKRSGRTFLWVARIICHNYKRIHPRPCFIRNRWRDALVTEHTWRLPVIREVDRNVVSGSDRPIPKKKGGKSIWYKEQSQWRERRKVARLEEGSTYRRCHTPPCSTLPCQSCSCCRHIRRKRMGRTSLQ